MTIAMTGPTGASSKRGRDAPPGWVVALRLRGGGKVGREGRTSGRSQRQHKPYKTPQDSDDPMSESRGVFCGNLSYETTWQALKDHMRQAGEVTRADILTDRATGRSKGCGVVEYEDAADARKALKDLHETELDGRQIFLREDREEGNPSAAAHSNSGPSSFDRPLSAPRSTAPQSRNRVYVGNLSWGKLCFIVPHHSQHLPPWKPNGSVALARGVSQ
jgi:RNA recognition motif-containing protein